MEAINNCSNCFWGHLAFDDEVVVGRCKECEHESSPNDPYPMWVAKNPSVDVKKNTWDHDEYMCPNCVTPWKCNGPHELPEEDVVNHPKHYTDHPSGIECIQITEHMGFCLGNAIKYIWRAGEKHESPIEDLKKARWYIDREITKLEKE